MPLPEPENKGLFTALDVQNQVQKWEEANQRQKLAINRLSGIIELARETVRAQAESPEETLQKVQEILS